MHESDPGRWYRPSSVHLVPYDPRWVTAYETERDSVVAALGPSVVAVEHVGSTAVPGLAAKPTIDILVAVSSWGGFAELVEALATLGYTYTPESEAEDPGRRVFRRGPADYPRMRTHHLHMTLVDGHYRRRILAFRDWLRTHPEDAAEYVRLKHHLAAVHAEDSRAYTSGKTAFVTSVERRAGVSPPAGP